MKKAFTLVELLIVIIIIGILATIAIPQYNKMVVKSHSPEAFVILSGLAKAVFIYYQQVNDFPWADGTSVFTVAQDVDFDLPAQTSYWKFDSGSGSWGSQYVGKVKVSDTHIFFGGTYELKRLPASGKFIQFHAQDKSMESHKVRYALHVSGAVQSDETLDEWATWSGF